MTDAELIEFATEFREGILDGAPSRMMCFAVSAPLAGLLNFYGVDAKTVEGDVGNMNHIWIELSDGRVLDATADQFDDMPAVYLGKPAAIHSSPIKDRRTSRKPIRPAPQT